MTTESTDTSATTPTRFVKSIHFHGLELAVLNADGIDYIPARPLCDLAGLNWNTAQRTLKSPDKVYLYGLKRLIPPSIAGFHSHKATKNGDDGELKFQNEGVLYLRLDCSQMYVAQISTERMRANGNHEGANQVLALQKEWARALHAYETHGIAVKAGRRNMLRELAQSARAIEQVRDARTRHLLAGALREELAALGLPASTLMDEQPPLSLSAVDPICELIGVDWRGQIKSTGRSL